MTWHPTTNQTPFGILNKDQQVTLEMWPYGHEIFTEGAWITKDASHLWSPDHAYRGKPAPVVTSWWLNVYSGGVSFRYESRSEANCYALRNRIDVLRIDTCNGVSTAHLEGLNDE
jgi:hypothetical protein